MVVEQCLLLHPTYKGDLDKPVSLIYVMGGGLKFEALQNWTFLNALQINRQLPLNDN